MENLLPLIVRTSNLPRAKIYLIDLYRLYTDYLHKIISEFTACRDVTLRGNFLPQFACIFKGNFNISSYITGKIKTQQLSPDQLRSPYILQDIMLLNCGIFHPTLQALISHDPFNLLTPNKNRDKILHFSYPSLDFHKY